MMAEESNNVNALEQLQEIIAQENIRTVFQPIVTLKDGNILGYEALSRGPRGSELESPVQLFNIAMENGMVWELELLCRKKALERSKNCLNGFKLFLNVDPHIINDEKFRKGFTLDFLRQYNINPKSIIFEITEKTAISDFKVFRKVLSNYIDQGYNIAIDDTGSGYSGLKMLAETCPKYIKIDMDLIRDVDKDYLKRTLLETFQKFALMTNMSIIAEGIETEDELKALVDIGIDYGQGYYIQRPSEGFLSISPEAKAVILGKNESRRRLYFSSPSTLPVGEIARFEMPISPRATGQEVDIIFRSNSSIYGVPVVEKDNKPVGLIMRNKFYAFLASQYGYALYKSRPINLIKDSRPLILDYYTPLDQVSRISVTRKEDNLYDYVIITREGKYFGITTIKDLLINTTQLELNIAKHANPLTGLPGNLVIEERLKKAIGSDSDAVIYVDLDNFKAYNDVYGFENGDQVLLSTASVLALRLASLGCNDSFLGHIGGDDFLVIIPKEKAAMFCENIIEDFEKKKTGFYSEHDKKSGYILAKSRQGNLHRFPLITISLAVVISEKNTFANVIQLTEKVSEVKERCKQEETSCYFVHRG
ncbi:MAG: GGDEF domain-containing protein [Peptococcaceae bacterium]